MSDVEDELLALAGSDEEESGSERKVSRSPEPTSRREEVTSGRGSGSKKGKRRGNHDDSEEEEEGEASSVPGSPNSLDSAPMEESDSENEQPARPDLSMVATADDGEKYPVEGLYASMEEKAEIMRMREIDRETILAERRDEAQRYKENRLLRQLVSAQEEKEKEQQRRKRSADEADLEDGRKSSRQRAKVTESASSGIDALRRQRAEKNDRQRRREEGREREERTTPRKPARASDGYGDDEEPEWSRPKTPEVERQHSRPDVGLVDFQRLRIGRTNFAEVCFKPNFEKVMVDCYVRVLGKPVHGQPNKYHMLPIKAITSGKAYAMDDASGRKQMIVDQHFVAGIGKRTETYPFIAASTGKFTQEELDEYKRILLERGISFPKHSAMDAKLEELRAFVNYKLTNDEITQMVEKKRFLRKKHDPAMREQLLRSIEEAKESGNTVYVRQLEEELDTLGKPVGLAFRTSLGGSGGGKSANTQQERLAQLNAENRRRNMEMVRRAQLQERSRAKERDQKMARGELPVDDDSSKGLKTRAKFVSDANGTPKTSRPASGASTPANGTPRMGPSKGLPEVAKLQEKKFQESKGVPSIHKPLNDDDIIASLDLDIDEDID